jgi:hypothetical protein
MRDWEALVKQRLTDLALEPDDRAEVIAELAAHLEDACAEMRRQGMTEADAVRRTLSQAGSWQGLQQKVVAAKRREQFMKTRLRQLWFPGFLTLIAQMIFLAILRELGFQPRILGSGESAVLLYMPWLLSLPLFGAMGAYVSFRVGGSRGTAVLASVFPALALTIAFLLMFPIGFAVDRVFGRPTEFAMVASVLLRDGIGWIVVPGAALLAGGLLTTLLNSRPSLRGPVIG